LVLSFSGTYVTHEEDTKFLQYFSWGNLRGRGKLRDSGIDGNIILKSVERSKLRDSVTDVNIKLVIGTCVIKFRTSYTRNM